VPFKHANGGSEMQPIPPYDKAGWSRMNEAATRDIVTPAIEKIHPDSWDTNVAVHATPIPPSPRRVHRIIKILMEKI